MLIKRIKNLFMTISEHFRDKRLSVRKQNYLNAYQTIRGGSIPFYLLSETFLNIPGKDKLTYMMLSKADTKLGAFMDIMFEMAKYVDADLKSACIDGILRMPRFLEAAGFVSFLDIGVTLNLPIHRKSESPHYVTVQYVIPRDKGRTHAYLKYIGESDTVNMWQNDSYRVEPITISTLMQYASVINRNVTFAEKVKQLNRGVRRPAPPSPMPEGYKRPVAKRKKVTTYRRKK